MELQAELVSKILTKLAKYAEAGMTTLELEQFAEALLDRLGVQPYNKGYHPQWAKTPYPYILCTSVNNQIAHGMPSKYKLKDGDLLNIDIGIKVGEKCGDAALTIPIGELSSRDERLLRYARRTTYEGISVIKAGVDVSEIGKAMQRYASTMGYVINRTMISHCIGNEMHEDPAILNFDYSGIPDAMQKYTGKLEEGQVVCIEPMLTYKDNEGMLMPDGWTFVTKDGRKSAMFEHMVRVDKEGATILTTHFTKEVDSN